MIMEFKPNVMQILMMLTVLYRTCGGIDCYQCKSDEQEGCFEENLDKKYLASCPKSTQNFCRKSNSILYFTGIQEPIVIRECAEFRSAEQECYRGRYSRDSYAFTCECKGSACNNSQNLQFFFPTALFFSLFLHSTFAH